LPDSASRELLRARANQLLGLSGLLFAFIDHFPFPQRWEQDGANCLAMLANILFCGNHNVNRRQDTMQASVYFLRQVAPVRRATHNDQEIQITVHGCLSARRGTEKQNTLRLHRRDDAAGYFLDCVCPSQFHVGHTSVWLMQSALFRTWQLVSQFHTEQNPGLENILKLFPTLIQGGCVRKDASETGDLAAVRSVSKDLVLCLLHCGKQVIA
jgi:hypothetical protein